MSLAQQVAPHIPLLRRFSRALTGSQQSGDAYVMALLEALIADPDALRTDIPLRVALYHLLCKLWGSLKINLQSSAPTVDPSLTAGEAELVLACLAPVDSRPATAAQVADRIAALRT